MPISHVSQPMGRKAMKIARSKISRYAGSRAGKSAPKPVVLVQPQQKGKQKSKKVA